MSILYSQENKEKIIDEIYFFMNNYIFTHKSLCIVFIYIILINIALSVHVKSLTIYVVVSLALGMGVIALLLYNYFIEKNNVRNIYHKYIDGNIQINMDEHSIVLACDGHHQYYECDETMFLFI